MDLIKKHATINSLHREAKFFRYLCVSLVIVIIALSIFLSMQNYEPERIVIVPPTVKDQFWISQDQVSKSYYSQWGHYVMMLILNVTPDSVNFQNQMLLEHVATNYRSKIKAQLENVKRKIKEEKISTSFAVNNFFIDEEQSSIAFIGVLSSYVEGKKIADKETAYMAKFIVVNSRLLLSRFVETNTKDVFTPIEQT